MLSSRDLLLPVAIALLVTLALAATGARAEDVTIYRCTDAEGRLSLRDTPCPSGERQQTQTMTRPTDPLPRPAAAPTAPPTRAPSMPAAPQVVILQPPRPMYECVTPDGDTYTSETAEGNPRWVPLWTLGYPVVAPHGRYRGGGYRGHVDVTGGDVSGRVEISGGRHSGRPGRPGHPGPAVGIAGYPAGTWVRDACHPLPQQDVCGRLRDRRYALDRRYNSALQSERSEITREQRGIDARLANDCRGY